MEHFRALGIRTSPTTGDDLLCPISYISSSEKVFILPFAPFLNYSILHQISNIKTQKHKHHIKNPLSDSITTIMKYNCFIPLIFLVVAAVTEPIPLMPRGDGSCDNTLGVQNNPACPSGACCSPYNWCGYGAAWCGGPIPNGNGACDNSLGTHNNPACPPGACCSFWGWCGYGHAWCA
jgi:hypothetical protein